MQRKIFIGVDLMSSAKKHIARRIECYEELPIKWIQPDNYHITLMFIGYVEDPDLVDICDAVGRACEHVEMFDVHLDMLTLGPTAENPRLVWLTGEASEELRVLHENIQKELGIFITSSKEFHPHVTLGRIRKHRWADLEDTPIIREEVHIPVSVSSVTVFESMQENRKRKFITIDELPLS